MKTFFGPPQDVGYKTVGVEHGQCGGKKRGFKKEWFSTP